jgi:hypothetical protein
MRVSWTVRCARTAYLISVGRSVQVKKVADDDMAEVGWIGCAFWGEVVQEKRMVI